MSLIGVFYLVWFILTASAEEEENRMANKPSIMSERLKVEIAKELGFYDVVEREGWGAIESRDAGNMVKRAIEMAEKGLSQGNKSP